MITFNSRPQFQFLGIISCLIISKHRVEQITVRIPLEKEFLPLGAVVASAPRDVFRFAGPCARFPVAVSYGSRRPSGIRIANQLTPYETRTSDGAEAPTRRRIRLRKSTPKARLARPFSFSSAAQDVAKISAGGRNAATVVIAALTWPRRLTSQATNRRRPPAARQVQFRMAPIRLARDLPID
jgi:hypothetical protein